MYLITKEWSEKTPYYFYKTTNTITGEFYYGSGQLEKYKGSGSELQKAFKKYGKENFKIEKLRFFKTRKDAYNYEERFLHFIDAENINECYNQHNFATGGRKGQNKGKTIYIDKFNNYHSCSPNDTRVISGELQSPKKGKSFYMNNKGDFKHLCKNDPRVISGEFVHCRKGIGIYKDSKNNIVHTTKNDPRVISGELVGNNKNKSNYKDSRGNIIFTTSDDPRVISGELVGVTKGTKTIILPNGKTKKVPLDYSGEYVNINSKCIIVNGILYESRSAAIIALKISKKKFYKILKNPDIVINTNPLSIIVEEI